eukprot:EG_transcript_359
MARRLSESLGGAWGPVGGDHLRPNSRTRLEDIRWLRCSSIPAFVERICGELIRAKPTDPVEHLALYALRLLLTNGRRVSEAFAQEVVPLVNCLLHDRIGLATLHRLFSDEDRESLLYSHQYDHSPSSSKPLQALPRGFSRFSRNEFTPTSTMNMHMNGSRRHTRQLRLQDGLTETSILAGRLNLLGRDRHHVPKLSSMEVILRVGLPGLENYIICPVEGCITSDDMWAHILKHHDWDPAGSTEFDPETVSRPTEEYIVQKAELFAQEYTGEALKYLGRPGIATVFAYSLETPLYRTVNALMRQGDEAGIDQWWDFMYALDTALANLPCFEGVVYRGIDAFVPKHLYNTNSVVTWQAFSSSTCKPAVAREFLGKELEQSTFFIIQSKTGRRVADLSAHPEEEEVVFRPNSQFLVKGQIDRSIKALLINSGIDSQQCLIYYLVELVPSRVPTLADHLLKRIASYLPTPALRSLLASSRQMHTALKALVSRQARLVKAVQNRNLPDVQTALRDGADPNEVLKDGQVCLHIAAQNGDVDVTKALLRRGAQHSLPNRADDMPIHVACRHCLPPVDPLDCVTGEPLKSFVIAGDRHVRVPVHLHHGRWYYEVEILKLGSMERSMQVGWCTTDADIDVLRGLGANSSGWACDFGRRVRIHDVEWPYGDTQWKEGDVVGCVVDVDNHAMGFVLNGHVYDAFLIERRRSFQPCITVWKGTEVRLTLNHDGMRYYNGELLMCRTIDRRSVWPILCGQVNSAGHLAVAQALHKAGADINSLNETTFETPLEIAIVNSEERLINWLVSHKAEVSEKKRKGHALHLAATNCPGHIGLSLIRTAPTVDVLDHEGCTPLFRAVKRGNVGFANFLLERQADPNKANFVGATPLHAAIEADSRACFERLLRTGLVNANAQDRIGNTPLHLAIYNNKPKFVQMLLAAGVSVTTANSENSQPMHLVARFASLEAARLLLQHHAEVNVAEISGETPLHAAAKRDFLRTAKYLLEAGASALARDVHARLPVHLAALKGKLCTMQLLLEVPGLNWLEAQDDRGWTCLHMAAEAGMTECVQELLRRSAAVDTLDKQGNTPLMLAAYTGQRGTVELLVEAQADVRHVRRNGMTALHMACSRHHHPAVLRLLLRHGAVPHAMADGCTPLHVFAAWCKDMQLLDMLIDASPTDFVNQTEHDETTPLHVAISAGNFAVAERLLQAGAVVDWPNSAGETALHWACRMQRKRLVALLLQHGADPMRPNRDGVTPTELIAEQGKLMDLVLSCATANTEMRQEMCVEEMWDEEEARGPADDIVDEVMLDMQHGTRKAPRRSSYLTSTALLLKPQTR